MNLDGSGPETLSIVLSAARDWLRTVRSPAPKSASVLRRTHSRPRLRAPAAVDVCARNPDLERERAALGRPARSNVSDP